MGRWGRSWAAAGSGGWGACIIAGAARGSGGNAGAGGIAGHAVKRFIQCVGGGAHQALHYHSAIDHFGGQRLILKDSNPIAGIQKTGLAGFHQVADLYLTFFNEDERCGVRVFHIDVEYGATDGNHRSRRADLIVIRQTADVLDLNFNLAEHDLKQIFPIAAIIAEDHLGIGVDVKCAAVGDMENGIAVSPGNDGLLWLNRIARTERPGGTIAQDGNLTRKRNYFRCHILLSDKRRCEREKRQQWDEAPML